MIPRPPAAHTRFSWGRLLRVAALGLLLWGAALGLLLVRFGWTGAPTQRGWFFTKAALLTFGGAYAVLPYVFQGAVEHYHWLTPAQMMDGLALGETTPGPLIMVVTFVGFVAGWTGQWFGPGHPFAAGAAAALVVTYFTFLPSFLFILAGGPLVESTHGKLKYTAPLTAITAAVVGVILNLAVFFAYHTLWPRGLGGPFEVPALLIGLVALVALFRYRAGDPRCRLGRAGSPVSRIARLLNGSPQNAGEAAGDSVAPEAAGRGSGIRRAAPPMRLHLPNRRQCSPNSDVSSIGRV